MGSVAYTVCILILISCSAFFFFFNSNFVLGDGKELLVKKFRLLLDLKEAHGDLWFEHMKHGPSPAPTPAPSLQSRAHSFSRSPLLFHHRSHISPVQSFKGRPRDGDNERARRIIVASMASAGVALVIFGIATVLACRKLRSSRKKRCQRSKVLSVSTPLDKVSFNVGPEMFYLNSLASVLERDSSRKDVSEAKSCAEHQEEYSREKQNKDGSNSTSCLDDDEEEAEEEEEALALEPYSSSDDESFHSICNSHCSSRRISSASETNIDLVFTYSSRNNSPCRSPVSLRSQEYCMLRHATIEVSTENICNAHSDDSELLHQTSDASSTSRFCSEPKRNLEALTPSIQPIGSLSVPLASNKSTPTAPPHLPPKSSLPPPPLPPPKAPISHIAPNSSLVPTASPPKPPMSQIAAKSSVGPPPPPKTPISHIATNSSRGPPPPPPPPLFCNSRQPPPPPPLCLPQQGTPYGKDGIPLPKLKPLHWDKVRASPDQSMVWDKIRSSSFELDEKMIESLFGYNSQSSAKTEEAKGKASSPSKHVLENQRLQNITILLKALNATNEQVCDALMRGRGLTVQQLEALVKMAPSKEEEENLFSYEGDINELDPAEKFVKGLLNISFAFPRIHVMLYRENFEDEVVHLRKSFAMLEEACRELRSSRLFLRLLEAVLKTGNRMNVGTIRGGAKAFKLDALLKLADVKGTDGKTTLLHFVVQEIIRSEGANASELAISKLNKENKPKSSEEKEEDYRRMGLDLVLGLSNELSNVKRTAGMDLDVLIGSVSNLSSGMSQLKELVEDLTKVDNQGSFVQSMKSFLKHAERVIGELKDEEKQVMLNVREITEYYHGNVCKDEANPLRIFIIVRDFIGMLDRVCKDVKSLKASPVIPFR